MKLSVVIPCHNSAATLGFLLESLAVQSWSEPWEVVIVDNRSSDDLVAVAERFRPRLPNLKIVDAHERGGASYARNVGARAAKGEVLAFVDSDDEVGIGWLAAMGDALAIWDCVAARLGFEKLNHPSIAKYNSWHEQCSGVQRAWYPPYLEHVGGGTLGIKRAIHENIGGFDERYIALEDTEYCFRLQLAGYHIHFLPDAVVEYRCRQGLIERFRRVISHTPYNILLVKQYADGRLNAAECWKRYLKDWARLFIFLLKIRNRLAWEKFFWMLGWQIGSLKGSVKYRYTPVVLPCRP